ncbi:MAG: hypothetical protein Q9M89_02190 [Persephonella sp.]|nr:hypothetical protein [Persephonella sp.]
MYIGFNRDNNGNKLKFDISFGAGRTYNSTYGIFNLMLYIGFDAYSYMYVKPEARYLLKINQTSRLGIIINARKYISQFFWKYKVFLSYSPFQMISIFLLKKYKK